MFEEFVEEIKKRGIEYIYNDYAKKEQECKEEIERLNNIIKEVRKYILNTKMFTYGEEKEFFLKDNWYGKELLEILDKENK